LEKKILGFKGSSVCFPMSDLSGYRERQKKCRSFSIDQKENRISPFILLYFSVEDCYANHRYLVDLEDDISAPQVGFGCRRIAFNIDNNKTAGFRQFILFRKLRGNLLQGHSKTGLGVGFLLIFFFYFILTDLDFCSHFLPMANDFHENRFAQRC